MYTIPFDMAVKAHCVLHMRFDDFNFVSWVASQKKVLARNKNNQYRSQCAPLYRGQCDNVCIRPGWSSNLNVGLLLRHCLLYKYVFKTTAKSNKTIKTFDDRKPDGDRKGLRCTAGMGRWRIEHSAYKHSISRMGRRGDGACLEVFTL